MLPIRFYISRGELMSQHSQTLLLSSVKEQGSGGDQCHAANNADDNASGAAAREAGTRRARVLGRV